MTEANTYLLYKRVGGKAQKKKNECNTFRRTYCNIISHLLLYESLRMSIGLDKINPGFQIRN